MAPPGIAGNWPEEGAHHGGAAASKFHHLQCGLLGLAAASTVVTRAVCDPPRWLDERAYLLALWGAFLAGVLEIIAAVCGSPMNPIVVGRRAAARKKLTCCASSVVAAIIIVVVVTGSLSAAAAAAASLL